MESPNSQERTMGEKIIIMQLANVPDPQKDVQGIQVMIGLDSFDAHTSSHSCLAHMVTKRGASADWG